SGCRRGRPRRCGGCERGARRPPERYDPASSFTSKRRTPVSEPTASAPLKHPDRFFIDGTWATPSSNAKIDVINSGNEELFTQVAEAQKADIDRAVAAARQAFDRGPWPRMKHAERAQYLRAISKEMAKRTDDLAQIWTNESGVIHGIAKGGSMAIGGIYDYY